MYSIRPTRGELDKKIKGARVALNIQSGLFAHPAKAVGELYALNIESNKHLWELILELLNEITPEDYVGGRPPFRSYEKTIEDSELFAFCWNSERLNKKMYIKFALKRERYYYVSLHESKEKV